MIGGENYFPFQFVENNFTGLFDPDLANARFFASGRDAIFSIFQHLGPKRVWIPNYLCKSIFTPLSQLAISIHFYDIRNDLTASLAWLDETTPGDAVLIIHYFGHVQDDLLAAVRGRGLTVVSDATHLPLSEEAWAAVRLSFDWVVGSLRKSAPFPDGGFCIGPKSATLPSVQQVGRPNVWVPRAAAFLSRGASMAKGYTNDESFPLITEAEDALDGSPAGTFGMSFLSRSLLEGMSLTSKRRAVRDNSADLLNRIPQKFIHPISRKGAGLYFICQFEDTEERNRARARFAEGRIYLPVHWDTSFLQRPHPLSGQLLSIPCDDRYQPADFTEIVTKLKETQ